MTEYINQLVDLLAEPFFIRAIIGGLLISLTTSIIGIFITLRKESFISDGIAHASLSGVALGLLLGLNPTFFAMIFAIIMAVIIVYLKRRMKISLDSGIGIIYPFLFSIGIILLFVRDRYSPELETYIFGNIITTKWIDIIYVGVMLSILIIFMVAKYRELLLSTISSDLAKIRGIKVDLIDYIFTIIAALIAVTAIKIVGIVLVTAFIVIPAAHAKLYAKNFKDMFPIAILHNVASFIIGITISINYPPGASIVVVSSVIYFISIFLKKVISK